MVGPGTSGPVKPHEDRQTAVRVSSRTVPSPGAGPVSSQTTRGLLCVGPAACGPRWWPLPHCPAVVCMGLVLGFESANFPQDRGPPTDPSPREASLHS